MANNSNNNNTMDANTSNKVFVGNLAFRTTPDELKNSFEQVGKVKAVNIISRGNRSLGYGFVEFNDEKDALRAVGEMNKKKLVKERSMLKKLNLVTLINPVNQGKEDPSVVEHTQEEEVLEVVIEWEEVEVVLEEVIEEEEEVLEEEEALEEEEDQTITLTIPTVVNQLPHYLLLTSLGKLMMLN